MNPLYNKSIFEGFNHYFFEKKFAGNGGNLKLKQIWIHIKHHKYQQS